MEIRPLRDRIVVKRVDEHEEKTAGGIVVPDSVKEKPQLGEVVATGRGSVLESGEVVSLEVNVGDRVLFGKYSGSEIKSEGEEYLILREDEVLAVLDELPGESTRKERT